MSYLTGSIKESQESRPKQIPALFKPKETQMGNLSPSKEELEKFMKEYSPSKMQEAMKRPKSATLSDVIGKETEKSLASKIEKYRRQAEDKSLPQDIRNQFLDNANELERKMGEKEGKFAKGGMVKKKRTYAKGGMAKKKMAYAKGGYANCGASVPPAQKGKK